MHILLPGFYIYEYLVPCVLFPVNIIPQAFTHILFFFQLY